MKFSKILFVVLAMVAFWSIKMQASSNYESYTPVWGVTNGILEPTDRSSKLIVTPYSLSLNGNYFNIQEVKSEKFDVSSADQNIIHTSGCSAFIIWDYSYVPEKYSDQAGTIYFELSKEPVSTSKGKFYLFRIAFTDTIILLTKDGEQQKAAPKKNYKRKAPRKNKKLRYPKVTVAR